MATGPPYISAQVIRELVSMKDVIEAVEKGLKAFSADQVIQPVRSVVPVVENNGFLGLMPAYCNTENCLATKLITFYPNNDSKGIPSHQGIVVQMDPSTGSVLAIIDGATITDMRTAAASAVALKYVMPCLPSTSSILCIVGTGVQARGHAEALQVICQFSEIRIWGRNADRAQKCAVDIGGPNTSVYSDLQTACRDADVIVTVTMATEPIVKGEWLKDGAVVLGVGACRPDWRELDDELMKNSLLIVDSRAAALQESGDVILSKAEIFSEVGELVAKGPVTMDTVRSLGQKFVVFKSLGIGTEDAITGQLIAEKYTNTKN